MKNTTNTCRQLSLALATVCLVLPAHAGRPLAVDDAGVDDVGQGHVEVWWEGQRGERGTSYLVPAFTPVQGLELGVMLARDQAERQTLQGLQAKWLWSPAQEQGCNTGSSAGITHRRSGSSPNAGNVWALTLIGTCAASWGKVNANLGGLREQGQSWQATWGGFRGAQLGLRDAAPGGIRRTAQRTHVPGRRPLGMGPRQTSRCHDRSPKGSHLAQPGLRAGLLTSARCTLLQH